jgi:hypothetical protein
LVAPTDVQPDIVIVALALAAQNANSRFPAVMDAGIVSASDDPVECAETAELTTEG